MNSRISPKFDSRKKQDAIRNCQFIFPSSFWLGFHLTVFHFFSSRGLPRSEPAKNDHSSPLWCTKRHVVFFVTPIARERRTAWWEWVQRRSDNEDFKTAELTENFILSEWMNERMDELAHDFVGLNEQTWDEYMSERLNFFQTNEVSVFCILGLLIMAEWDTKRS